MAWGGFYFQIRLAQVFGLVSWVELEAFELVDKIPYKLCPLIPASILFLEQSMRALTAKSVTKIPPLMLNFLNIFSIFQSTYVKKKEWIRLLQLYEVTNKQIHSRTSGSIYLGGKPFLITFSYMILLLVSRTISHYYSPRRYGLLVDLTLCIELVEDSLVIYLLAMLAKGLKMVNREAKHLLIENVIMNIGDKRMHRSTPAFSRHLYRNIYQMSVCINDIFSWMIASNLISYLIKFCVALQNMIHMISTGQLVTSSVIRFALSFAYRTVS